MAPWSRVGKASQDYSQLQHNHTKASALLDLGKSISDRRYNTCKSPESKTNWDHLRNEKTFHTAGVWRVRGADGKDGAGGG